MEQGTIKESVSMAISQALAVTRWSKQTLAAQIGVRSSTIRRWANGEVTDFTLLPVAALFKYAGLSLDEAFGLRASVPSKGVDDVRVWRERAEMYEGLLKILTKQTLMSVGQPIHAVKEEMPARELAKLPSLKEIQVQQSAKPAEQQESGSADDRTGRRKSRTG